MRTLAVLLMLGLATPARALDSPHDANDALGCPSCHLTGPSLPAWYTAAPDPLDPDSKVPSNRLCWSCHNEPSGALRRVRTHSQFATSGSEGWRIDCVFCHEPHRQSQPRAFGAASYLATGTLATVGATQVTTVAGTLAPGQYQGHLLIADVTRPDTTYRITWNDADTILVRGTIDVARVQAGATFAIVYGRYLRTDLNGASVRLFDRVGQHSFADGDATLDGVCEVCHTLTAHHVNTGSGDLAHYPGKQCTLCHLHSDGFAPSAADGNDCVTCHKSPRGRRRQIVDTNADGTGTGGDFILTSHHLHNASGTATNADCQVCHDLSLHGSGVIQLVDADTGALYPYNPTKPITAEVFCLSCHDANGANADLSPFADGTMLGPTGSANAEPYRAAAEVALNWSKAFGHRKQGLTCLGDGTPGTGCHASGHGSEYRVLLAKNLNLPNTSNGYYFTCSPPSGVDRVCTPNEADYDLCFSCHGATRYPKEYILGVKCPPIGETWTVPNYCHDHDQTPWVSPDCSSAPVGDPALCPPVDPPYKLAATLTGFRDRNEGSARAYDDYSFFTGQRTNLHLFHLTVAGYTYRGGPSGGIDCVACHSVHGSDTEFGQVYDQLQWNHYDEASTPAAQPGEGFGMMSAAPASLADYPTYCGFNCHDIIAPTSAWTTPVGEP